MPDDGVPMLPRKADPSCATAGARAAASKVAASTPAALDVWRRGKDAPRSDLGLCKKLSKARVPHLDPLTYRA